MKRIFNVILALCLITAQTAWAYTQEELSTPLTLEFPSDGSGGTVTIKNPKALTMKYSINGGDKQTVGDKIDDITITVPSGKTVQLYGNASFYYGTRISCDADCYIYGNIMSLVDETGFASNTTLTDENTFAYLFFNNTYLKNHTDTTKELLLPATTLTTGCYSSMFQGCSNLTTAPALPAETLAWSCYQAMFSGCTKLNYVKCLATDLSATGCTTYWLDGVAETGTFVKAEGASWGNGGSGIPDNWTTIDFIPH